MVTFSWWVHLLSSSTSFCVLTQIALLLWVPPSQLLEHWNDKKLNKSVAEFFIKHAQDPGYAGLSWPDLKKQLTNQPWPILVVIWRLSVHVINLFTKFTVRSTLANWHRKIKLEMAYEVWKKWLVELFHHSQFSTCHGHIRQINYKLIVVHISAAFEWSQAL